MCNIQKSIIINSLLLIGISCSSTVLANSFSIGAGALIDRSAYRGYDTKVYPLPAINYENDYVFLKGTSAGLYALKTETDRVTIQIAYLPGRFKTSDTGDHALKQLDNRKLSFMAGAGYTHRADWGNIYFNVMTDISGNSKGSLADLGYGYSHAFGQLYIEPKVGVEWQDRKYNNYYFGVNKQESLRSGLRQYSADNGINPYIAIHAFYQFSKNWQAFALARHTFLNSEIKDSPMTSRSSTTIIGTGITYRF